MATITHLFAVNDIVYHVDETYGVRRAVVKKVTIDVMPAVTTIMYNVAFADPTDGIINAPEAALFANVDDALAFYKAEYVIG